MVFADKKISLKTLLVITVASSLMVTGCSSSKEERDHVKIDPKALHAPVNNPALQNGQVMQREGMRTPEGNAGMGTGSSYAVKSSETSSAAPSPAAEKKESGWFDWAYKDQQGPGGQKASPATPAAASSAPAQRKVPALNHEGMTSDAIMAPSTYQAAAAQHVDSNAVASADVEVVPATVPTAPVSAAPVMAESQPVAVSHDFAPVEPTEMAAVSTPKSYPSLSSVPPRPERLDAAEKGRDQKFAELEQEYNATTRQDAALNAQVAHDTAQDAGATQAQPTSMAQDGYAGIQSYGEEVHVAEGQPKAEAPQVVAESAGMQTFAANGEQVAPAQEYAWQSSAARHAAPSAEKPAGMTPPASASSYEPAPAAMQASPAELPVVEAPVVAYHEEIPVVREEAPAAVVEAPTSTVTTTAVANAEPAPMTPQAQVVPVQENEWVEVTPQQTAAEQAAAPVANEQVAVVPQADNVVMAPEAAAIALTPPSTLGTIRQLPDSRYNARRQAVYAQQYARRAAVDRAN